jgi:hypothetical protein
MKNREQSMMYETDEDTLHLLEVALNCMVTVAEAQMSEENAEAMMLLADELADRFGIEKVDTEVLEGQDEDGNDITIIREVKASKGPVFKISDAGSTTPDSPSPGP